MKYSEILIFSWIMLVASSAFAAARPNIPPLEASNYQNIPKTAEVSSYLEQIADGSREASVINVGTSAGGRPITAILLSKDKQFLQRNPGQPDTMTVMLNASQHGSESSGGEALQVVAENILHGDLHHYLDSINFILVPISNPDGRDRKKRVNDNGVNLSTDYILLSQPETQAMSNFIYQMQPDVMLDIHESSLLKKSTLGAEGYLTDFEAQWEYANDPNINANLQAFARDEFLPTLITNTNNDGVRASHYIGEITSTKQEIHNGGISLRNLRNFGGQSNALSMLVENRLDLSTGDYPTPRNIKERVRKQVVCVDNFIKLAEQNRIIILGLVKNAKLSPTEIVYLDTEYVLDEDNPTINIPLRHIDSGKLEEITFPNATKIRVGLPLQLPSAYVVTKNQQLIKELLDKHHIAYTEVSTPIDVKVVVQHIQQVQITPTHLGRAKVTSVLKEEEKQITLEIGALLILMDQPGATIVPLFLDPRSSNSIFQDSSHTPLLTKGAAGKDFFIVRVIN
jgi:hypothetical protein